MLERLKKVMRESLPQDAEDITPATLLTEDLGFDSLDRIQLALGVETEFFDDRDLISDEESTGWKTVGDIIAFIEKNASEVTQ